MTSIIRLTPISGAMGETPPCYLLQIDDFRFLLDTGWDEKFDSEFIAQLTKHSSKIDAVLLSHSDTYHLGALPYLVGKCGLKCPVYATVPIFKMGQMFMYDTYLNHHNTREFSLFNLDDVDAAFDKIIQLEFGHSVGLKGKGLGISITALPAGHALGGTVWKISKVGEEDIYYAIDHNNKKERHLNGCEFEKMQRPGILITNSFNSLYVQEKRRKRDEMLMGVISQTLRVGGNVLIATDTAGRSLELVLMLDQMWRTIDCGLAPYSLVFLNNVAFNVLEFAKSQIEWMGEKLRKSYESTSKNPFQLRNVVICHTLLELSQISSPKVVVTSSADLESGFARDLFLQWCQDPHSSVVLTNRTSPGTLGRTLIDSHAPGKFYNLDIKQKIKLEGKELEDYLRAKKEKKEILYCSDSDGEDNTTGLHNRRKFSRFSNINGKGRVNGVHHQNNNTLNGNDDISIVKMSNGNGKLTFPEENPRKRKFDDYGEIVRVEDFKENGLRKRPGQQQHQKPTRKSESEGEENEPPVKYLCMTQMFIVNCKVHFIDFEGRSDVEAVLKMLQEMQPHKLVLVRGTQESTIALQALCQSFLPDTKIYKPGIGQMIDLTMGNQLLQVTLSDPLVSSLEFQKLRGMELSWVDGQLSNANPLKTDAKNAPSTFETPFLNPLPNALAKTRPCRNPLFINKLRLSEFKQILLKNEIQSEYNNGVLIVKCENGTVYIQRDSQTKNIVVESEGLTDEYYKIRSLLYEQFAII